MTEYDCRYIYQTILILRDQVKSKIYTQERYRTTAEEPQPYF